MLAIKLAIKNLLHAGLRTWLNISALTLVFIMILFVQGLYSGMFHQIEHNMIEYEVAGGQYWQENYDQHNPLSIDDSYAGYDAFQSQIEEKHAVPILLRSGVIYTESGMRGVLIKGIDRDQTLLNVPTSVLHEDRGYISAYIGKIMAKQANLQKGDVIMLRFRDRHGMNNAIEASIDSIMHVPLQSVDVGQIWVDLEHLQELTDMEDQASMLVIDDPLDSEIDSWEYQGMDVMFADLAAWKAQEMTGGYMMMAIFLGLAVLAVFDTQILSIFRRKKEIGTLVALGMRQHEVLGLFTLEGMLIGVFSMLIGSAVGIPMLLYFQKTGINLGNTMEGLGLNIMNVLYPECSWNIIWTVSITVLLVVAVVSFLAAKRIAKMNIVQVLKGK
jgi:ABC-type lipoprotein release transport system permease subunit